MVRLYTKERSHPIELYFAPKDLIGWPKGIARVWRLDSSGKMDLYSCGVFNFPRTVSNMSENRVVTIRLSVKPGHLWEIGKAPI